MNSSISTNNLKRFLVHPKVLGGLVAVLLILLTAYTVAKYYKVHDSTVPAVEVDIQGAYGFNPPEVFQFDDGKVKISHESLHLAAFRLDLKNSQDYDKLRIHFSNESGRRLKNISFIQIIFENSKTAGKVVANRSARVVKPLIIYDIPLIKRDFDSVVVLLRGNRNVVDEEIEKIQLLGNEFQDQTVVPFFLIVLLSIMLLMPGSLVISWLTAKNQSHEWFLMGLGVASLVYYIGLYLVLEMSFRLGFESADLPVFVAFVLSLGLLLYANFKTDRFSTLNNYLYTNKTILCIFLVVLILLMIFVAHDTVYPFQNFSWQSISGKKTFNTFAGHDNYFQFANGRVIQENLPFSAEYGPWEGNEKPLLFSVADREILPGVIYAVFRAIIAFVNPDIGKSFIVYTIFGIAMNLMMIFPILVLAKRYMSVNSQWLLFFILLCNAMFIAEASLTWFKFSGAALFLSAIAILLFDRSKLQYWLISGLCLGLAANMHPAVAIGIPFYYLYFVFLHAKQNQFRLFRFLPGPLILFIVFVLVKLPWSLVKQYSLNESVRLAATHLFGGYGKNKSLLESATIFFQKVPLSEQLPVRVDRVITSFRLDELTELLGQFTQSNYWIWLKNWSLLEFGYTIFVYYPLLLLLVIGFIINKITLAVTHDNNKWLDNRTEQPVSELKWLIWIGVLTQLTYSFASYSHYVAPDVGWHQPLGVTVLIQLGLILLLLRHRIMWIIAFLYTVFSAWRLYMLI